ncbi:hypothetical protein [Corynebacterium matruchotii]
MVFGWRQEFSCGFGVAWAGSERKPSLANVLPPRGRDGVGRCTAGWYGAERRRQGGGAPGHKAPRPWALPRAPGPARPVGDN